MKTVAKVFIIISSIFEFWLIIPLIIGIIALDKLNKAKTPQELTGIAIVTLLFTSLIGGILMLCISEKDLQAEGYVSSTTVKANAVNSESNAVEQLKELKKLFDNGIITQEIYEEKRKKYLDMI